MDCPENNSIRSRHLWTLAALLLGLLALRVVAVVRADNIASDGPTFLAMSREIATEGLAETVLRYDYHPGYPAMVSAVGRGAGLDWPGGWVSAAQGISILMGLVAVTAVFLIGAELISPWPALLGAGLFGLGERWIEINADVLSGSAMLALCMLGLLWSLRMRRLAAGRPGEAVAMAAMAGMSIGLGYLVRPEALVMLLAAGGLAFGSAHEQKVSVGRKFLLAGVVLLTTATAVAPYAIWIGSLTAKKDVSDFASPGGWPLAVAGPQLWLGAMGTVVDAFRSAMGNVATVFLLVTLATWFGRYLLRLKLPGQVVYTPGAGAWWALAAPAGAMLAVVTALEAGQGGARYVSSRHLLIPAAVLAPLAGLGVFTCVQWTLVIHRRWKIPHWPPGAWGIWVGLSVAAALVFAFPVLHENKGPARTLGLELRDKLPRDYYWIGAEPWTPFFAGAPMEQFRNHQTHPWRIRFDRPVSVDSLLSHARQLPGSSVCLAVDSNFFDDYPGLQQKIEADGRFTLLARKDGPRYIAYLYLCRPGRG
ncbi:MAG: hypothetical protein ACLFUJ_13200 [Phycisphaerae bacterium]